MLTCKIYDTEEKELLSMEINHFAERVRKDNELELTCQFNVLPEQAATEINAYKGIVNIPLKKVAFFKDDVLIVEYNKYTEIGSVQVEYGEKEFSGKVVFLA